MRMTRFDELVGRTIKAIERTPDELKLALEDGSIARLYHYQDCCESVEIHDVNGDLDDLVDSPVVLAAEVSDAPDPDDEPRYYNDSHTWTFYRIGTVKGTVVVRWLGQSNGYYSESVSFTHSEKEN